MLARTLLRATTILTLRAASAAGDPLPSAPPEIASPSNAPHEAPQLTPARTSHWEITARGGGWIHMGGTHDPIDVASDDRWGGGAGTSLTYYTAPVVDDATPAVLQPFLQRSSTLQWRGRIDVDRHVQHGLFGPTTSDTQIDGIGAFAADVYLRPFLALRGWVGFMSVDTPAGYTRHEIPLELAVGLRFGDTRIDAGYRIRFWARIGLVPPPYGIVLSVRSVISRRFDLELDAYGLGRGACGVARAGFSVSRELTLSIAAIGGYGGADYGDIPIPLTDFTSTPMPYSQAAAIYGGAAGVAYWIQSRVGLSVSYSAFHWDLIRHDVSVGVAVRL